LLAALNCDEEPLLHLPSKLSLKLYLVGEQEHSCAFTVGRVIKEATIESLIVFMM